MVEAVSGSGISQLPPTLDARARFGSNLFLLNGTEMGHVMASIEDQCPEALETFGDKYNIEINVDKIPTDVFADLNSYVMSKVGDDSDNDNEDRSDSPGNSGSNRRKRHWK